MKVILSRKGFDVSNGGCPSPIFPDNTMLSMPIPDTTVLSKQKSSPPGTVFYDDLRYDGMTYKELLKQIHPKGSYASACHLDPDLRPNARKTAVSGWLPAFGQQGAALSTLHNAGVSIGDLFLFFGWFHRVKRTDHGYRYTTRGDSENFYHTAEMHVIYGYLQIGEILTNAEEIKQYAWHPHANTEQYSQGNALYLPSEKLSFSPELPGYGTFCFREDRVLTMKGKSRATWTAHEFLLPDCVYGNRKNSAKSEGLYYAGIWQELILSESPELLEWVKRLFS